MYIKRYEANIASRSSRHFADPDISLIRHNGVDVYALTSTLSVTSSVIGTIHEDANGLLWIALNTVRMEDVQIAAQATDAAWEDARAYADAKQLFNLSW